MNPLSEMEVEGESMAIDAPSASAACSSPRGWRWAYRPTRSEKAHERLFFTAITMMPEHEQLSFEELRLQQQQQATAVTAHGGDERAPYPYRTTMCTSYNDFARVYHSIGAMDEYAHQSHEELRYEMWLASRGELNAMQLGCEHAKSPEPCPERSPSFRPTLVAENLSHWGFVHAVTAMDAFADRSIDRSFEELRFEARCKMPVWASVLTHRKHRGALSKMELRVREEVEKVMNETPKWWVEFQQAQENGEEPDKWVDNSRLRVWCVYTITETTSAWYPKLNDVFKERHQQQVEIAAAAGEWEHVPISLEWMSIRDVIGFVPMENWSPDVRRDIDSFAFIGFYVAQANIVKELRDRDPAEWPELGILQQLKDRSLNVGSPGTTLVWAIVRFFNTRDDLSIEELNSKTSDAVADCLDVQETRPEVLELLRFHALRIHHYLTQCQDAVINALRYLAQQAIDAGSGGFRRSVIDLVAVKDDEKHVVGLEASIDELSRSAIAGQDWFPDYKDTFSILDPAMYPLRVGVTRRVPCFLESQQACDPYTRMSNVAFVKTIPVWLSPVDGDERQRLRWLPSDVDIDASGRAHFASYINNLHPNAGKSLYNRLEDLLTSLLPMFEHALRGLCDSKSMDATWFSAPHPLKPYARECLDQRPAPSLSETTFADPPITAWTLKGSRIQVVLSMHEIHLDAKKSKTYEFEDVQKFGLPDSDVVAAGVYCYGRKNVAGACMSFSTKIRSPLSSPRDPISLVAYHAMQVPTWFAGSLWLERCLGTVALDEGSGIVWPTTLEANRCEFELQDNSENATGYLKLVWIYLVAPGAPVISTAEVPPQQTYWANLVTSQLARRFGLPDPALDRIHAFSRMGMTHERALELHDEMKELLDGEESEAL